MIDAMNAAIGGMRSADALLAKTVDNIAKSGAPVALLQANTAPSVFASTQQPAAFNQPDIADEMVNLMLARLSMKANVVSARTAAQSYQDVLKLKSDS